MARIGNIPVPVPAGVTVTVKGPSVAVKGPKGELSWSLPAGVSAKFDDAAKKIQVTRQNEQKQTLALHGLSRALINNMVKGVSQGYEQRLMIFGTGYSCKLEGQTLLLNVGFMGRGFERKAQFLIPIPQGLTVTVETPAAKGETEPAKFLVKSCDKQLIGQFCAEVRKLRPPEPYKGKGIRYEGEFVKRKQGKAFAGSGGG